MAKSELVFEARGEGEHEVGFRRTEAAMQALESITIDRGTLRDRLEKFIVDLAAERFRIMGGDDVVRVAVERKVDAAVSRAAKAMESKVEDLARKAVEDRVRAIVAAMPIRVDLLVSTGNGDSNP